MREEIEEQYEEAMKEVARMVDRIFNPEGEKETGFMLLTFPLGTAQGRINYLSNGKREDCIVAMEEFLENVKKDAE